MQRLIANIKINDFEDVEDTQRFVAWVVFATLGGAFHVPRSQAVDFAEKRRRCANDFDHGAFSHEIPGQC